MYAQKRWARPVEVEPKNVNIKDGLTSSTENSPPRNSKQQLSIHAEITGDDGCSACGVSVRSATPIFSLCRALIEAGHDPSAAMECYRGNTLAVSVRTIGEAAALTVRESTSEGRPRFVRYRSFAAGRARSYAGGRPPIAQNSPPLVPLPGTVRRPR
jgi:hypothetical protein